jgi:hypothetical protein
MRRWPKPAGGVEFEGGGAGGAATMVRCMYVFTQCVCVCLGGGEKWQGSCNPYWSPALTAAPRAGGPHLLTVLRFDLRD